MSNDTASARHRPSVAFLPEDKHILRCFGDPRGKPWRCVHMHQFQQRRTHCSNFFREIDPAGTYPACELCLLAKEPGNWRLRREALVLIYGSLLFTSHPSTYWRPGKTYLIIAPDRLRESLLQLLKQGNTQQRKHFSAMMNPAGPWAGDSGAGAERALRVCHDPLFQRCLPTPCHLRRLVHTIHARLDHRAGV